MRNNADAGGEVEVDSGDDAKSGDSSTDSECDDSDSNDDAETTIDIFRDARKLFPWHGSLRTQVKELWERVAGSNEEEVQLEKLQAIFRTLIFQHVRGEVFKSALLHFLAVLGIDEGSVDCGRRMTSRICWPVWCIASVCWPRKFCCRGGEGAAGRRG